MGNQIALALTNDDLVALGSKNAKRSTIAVAPKKSILTDGKGNPKIASLVPPPANLSILTGNEEADAKEVAKNNRTFTVSGLSVELAAKEGCPVIGDEVSLLAGTMTEMVVDGKIYGIIPVHRVLGIHAKKINPGVD